MVNSYPHTDGMKNKPSAQVLAENLDRLMGAHPTLKSNHALGLKAKVAHSHIRKIRLQETACTLDVLDKLASAFGRMPWELVADGDEIRQEAFARLGMVRTANDEEEEVPPKREAASRRKKGLGDSLPDLQ